MLPIILCGETLYLLSQRALYRPTNRTLYVADTHWGKAASFRAHYIPLPEGGLADELALLTTALRETDAERLVILGDLIHSRQGVDLAVVATVTAWRQQNPTLRIDLVPGNHDRDLHKLPAAWAIRVLPSIAEDEGLVLAHQPIAQGGKFVLCGHLHPVWTLQGTAKQRINLPCFIQTRETLILPAFSRFTGGKAWSIEGVQRVYGVTEQQVMLLLEKR